MPTTCVSVVGLGQGPERDRPLGGRHGRARAPPAGHLDPPASTPEARDHGAIWIGRVTYCAECCPTPTITKLWAPQGGKLKESTGLAPLGPSALCLSRGRPLTADELERVTRQMLPGQ